MSGSGFFQPRSRSPTFSSIIPPNGDDAEKTTNSVLLAYSERMKQKNEENEE